MIHGTQLVVTMVLVVIGLPAHAHHILGVPHYAYSEDYPQAPVLTYSADLGTNHLKMTGFPGTPEPGEACSLHVYISDIQSGTPFNGTVTLTVFRDGLFGPGTNVYGPAEANIEEATYKFFPRFDEEANYTVRIAYEADGVPWIIDLPMVAGEPGSPARVLGFSVAGVFAFLVVIRAIRIKIARRNGKTLSATLDEASEAGISRESRDVAI